MFTVNHIIWMIISFLAVAASIILLKKYNPPIKKVLSIACVGAVASELVKTFSVVQMVPSSDGSTMHLYIESQHLPLHLCSIQLILIFIARFGKESRFKDALLAFMYPTCIVGAFFAILLPSIFPTTVDPQKAFVDPHAYQYFLYHAMLIILGAYIVLSRQVNLRPKHYFTTLGGLLGMAFISFYLNSIFASPTYVNGELISVDYGANFFFTFETPIGIELTQLWHWYIYLGVLITLVMLFLTIFYIPVFRAAKKAKA